jgi:hypothetical protein
MEGPFGMSTLVNRRAPRLAALVAAVAVVVVAVSFGAAHLRSGRGDGPDVDGSEVSVKLRVPLPAGASFDSISYRVSSAAGALLAQGTVPVRNAAALSHVVALPVGEGETIALTGHPRGARPDGSVLFGAKTFDVMRGGPSDLVVEPSAPPAGSAGGSTTTSAGAPVVAAANGAASSDDLTACQSCQRDSSAGICDPPNLTATSKTSGENGEQTAIGWGCATLPSDAARTACVALLHCLDVNDCGEKGTNPVMACYCGHAAPDACIGGQGLTGACVPQYQAAASASADGPPPSSDVGTLSRFIATNAADPITAVGLADNVRHCTVATPCEICGAL